MSFLQRLNQRLLNKGTGWITLSVYAIDDLRKLQEPELSPSVTVVDLNEKWIERIAQLRGEKKGQQLLNLLKSGAKGLALVDQDEILSYGWIGYNHSAQSKKRYTFFPIPALSGHIFECFTFEEHRGKGWYSQLVYQLAKKGKMDGMQTVYIDAVTANIAANKGIHKLGFSYVKEQSILLLLNKSIFTRDQ